MTNFGDAERARQARFRNASPTISEQGRSPTDDGGQRHDYMLERGCEDDNLYPRLRGEDGARKFLKERRVKWWFQRHYDSVGSSGPTRNMASSQIMCINFLLPLAGIPGALTAAVRAIDDDVVRVVDIHHEGRVSPVEFEWIGVPKSLEGTTTRGQYTTSVDAFVIADTGGGRRAYLMEWKYVEEESSEDYGVDSASGKADTRRRRYSALYSAVHSSFNGEVPMDLMLYGNFYQLMRNRLLADRMVVEQELGVMDAKLVVVAPEGNSSYREGSVSSVLSERCRGARTVEEVMQAALKNPDSTFATVSPSLLLESVERECGASVQDWSAYMRERYGI